MFKGLFNPKRQKSGAVTSACVVVLTKGSSFLAGGGKNGISQPVRPLSAGTSDSSLNGPHLIRPQANSEHCSERVFLRQSRPPHFLGHICRLSVYKKYLTVRYFSFTKSLVCYETELFQANARKPLERLADQRHPARTGAGAERLAMNNEAVQAGNSARQSRSLVLVEQSRGLCLQFLMQGEEIAL